MKECLEQQECNRSRKQVEVLVYPSCPPQSHLVPLQRLEVPVKKANPIP